MSKYRIRTVKTASGATAVQVIWYECNQRKIAKHIGSAKNSDELEVLRSTAEEYIQEYEPQLSLLQEKPPQIVLFDHIEVKSVSHQFARTILLLLARQSGLEELEAIYLDLVIMRIIEPCSKLRSIDLMNRYFHVSYSQYVYEHLPKLLDKRELIEAAAIKTARSFNAAFALLLYDVTTLYFETHKQDDELQARGFSKDDKSKQPQIVIGLLVTGQGYPLIHEVFKGSTFEGHTMLSVINAFQKRYSTEKPIIVADAAMLSKTNRETLHSDGYRYIVGARLANAGSSLLLSIDNQLPKEDGATIRLSYPDMECDVICSYSSARYKKDKRELDKQIDRARVLIAHQEPGKRAKFVKKSKGIEKPYTLDEDLKQKAELLLGVKGYYTNVSESTFSNGQVIQYYHELWHVEQAFRMSKSDLKARPIFHYTHDAIRAHIMICFMGLMIGKLIEIKSGFSLRHVRDLLWSVQEVHLRDPDSGRERIVRSPIPTELMKILNSLNVEIPH